MASGFTISGDWRDLRGAIERAAPEWHTADDETRKMLWDFAEAVVAEHPWLKAECWKCGKIVHARSAYRCADCKAHFCERCIHPHFGPNHRSHS